MRLAKGATAAPSVWSWTVTTRDRHELGSAARRAQDAGGWARLVTLGAAQRPCGDSDSMTATAA
jgi:hypothetical protein